MASTVFEPAAVKELIRLVCVSEKRERLVCAGSNGTHARKDDNHWIVDWTQDWTRERVDKKVEAWIGKDCASSREQLRFAAEVVCYLEILERAMSKAKVKPSCNSSIQCRRVDRPLTCTGQEAPSGLSDIRPHLRS